MGAEEDTLCNLSMSLLCVSIYVLALCNLSMSLPCVSIYVLALCNLSMSLLCVSIYVLALPGVVGLVALEGLLRHSFPFSPFYTIMETQLMGVKGDTCNIYRHV